jgi:hypothetical protein
MPKRFRCIDARAAMTLPIFLALESRQIPIIFEWLDVQTFGLLDIASSSYNEGAVVDAFEVQYM